MTRSWTPFIAVSLLALISVSPVRAAGRFATVDMARVLREWVEVKKVAAWLQQKKEEYQQTIDQKQMQIKKINDDMQDPNVPQPKKDSLDKQKRDLLRDLQGEFQNLKVKLADLEKEEFDRIKQRIYYEIDAVVQARGLEMVFEKQWLYFPRDGADITEELLRTLDARGGAQPRRGPPAGNGNGNAGGQRRPQPPQGQN